METPPIEPNEPDDFVEEMALVAALDQHHAAFREAEGTVGKDERLNQANEQVRDCLRKLLEKRQANQPPEDGLDP